MAKELNTLAPKKWVANYSGAEPTIDTTDGVSIGDFAFDNSTTPYKQWRCLVNTDSAPVWVEIAPVTEIQSTAPTVTIHNTTEEDGEGGREGKIIWKGEQSGGELSTLGQIEFSHDGTSDDQKGKCVISTNDGSDNDAPTARMTIDSSGNVGIGSAPSTKLHILAAENILRLESSNAGATADGYCELDLYRNSASPANGDELSIIKFSGKNDAAEKIMYAQIKALIADKSDGAEDGKLEFHNMYNGSLTNVFTLYHNGIISRPQNSAVYATAGTTDQTLSTTSEWATVVFGTEILDSRGEFSSNTFTATVAGRYLINAHVNIAALANGKYFQLGINVNSAAKPAYKTRYNNGGAGSKRVSISITKMLSLSATDTVIIQYYHDDADTITLDAVDDSGVQVWLDIQKID